MVSRGEAAEERISKTLFDFIDLILSPGGNGKCGLAQEEQAASP